MVPISRKVGCLLVSNTIKRVLQTSWQVWRRTMEKKPDLPCRRQNPQRGSARLEEGRPAVCLVLQGAPKKKKKKRGYLPTYLFLRFFEIFRSDFRKYFYGVFGLLMQRNGQKRDKKKIDGKRRKEKSFFFLNFFGQKFLT